MRPALPVCARCGRPALLGGWVEQAPHVRRWACPTCAGVKVGRPHPFATVTCPTCAGAGRVLADEAANVEAANSERAMGPTRGPSGNRRAVSRTPLAGEAGGLPARTRIETGGAADLAENNLARTDRVQLALDLGAVDDTPPL